MLKSPVAQHQSCTRLHQPACQSHARHVKSPPHRCQPAATQCSFWLEQFSQNISRRAASGAVALAAAALLAAPLPAIADVEMVAPSQAISAAKPLPEQTVSKGKVWLLLAGGSAALFGTTVVLEKQAKFFPAIAKANEAMERSAAARQQEQEGSCDTRAGDAQQQQQGQQQSFDSGWDSVLSSDDPGLDAVLQGLQSASRRVLGDEAAESSSDISGGSSSSSSPQTDAQAASTQKPRDVASDTAQPASDVVPNSEADLKEEEPQTGIGNTALSNLSEEDLQAEMSKRELGAAAKASVEKELKEA